MPWRGLAYWQAQRPGRQLPLQIEWSAPARSTWENRLDRAFIAMLTADDDDAYHTARGRFWNVWREKVNE